MNLNKFSMVLLYHANHSTMRVTPSASNMCVVTLSILHHDTLTRQTHCGMCSPIRLEGLPEVHQTQLTWQWPLQKGTKMESAARLKPKTVYNSPVITVWILQKGLSKWLETCSSISFCLAFNIRPGSLPAGCFDCFGSFHTPKNACHSTKQRPLPTNTEKVI